MGKENVVGKIVMSGRLTVESPLLIGAGQDDHLSGNDKDIHVLRVADKSGTMRYIIPGTSLAGVLRDMVADQSAQAMENLFGEMTVMQSSVNVYDIVLDNALPIYRDGVRIDEDMGSAVDGAKYDYEAIERGAQGDLRLVITLRGIHTTDYKEWKTSAVKPEILNAICYIRECLEKGIKLGAMTAKGLGRVKVKDMQVGFYDFANKKDVVSWLAQATPEAGKASRMLKDKSTWNEADHGLMVEADFALKSSLIVRDYGTEVRKDKKRIITSLKSGKDYVIPGTSIKGVLRHQAAYILESLGSKKEMLETLMGTADSKTKSKETEGRIKSRFYVDEAYITQGKNADVTEVEITRNRIDRFTGGTIESALFTERPLWQKDDRIPTVKLKFSIKGADDKEAGLSLFLLKDLWQGKIALGGEAGVGRGTLKGLKARIKYHGDTYEMDKDGKVVTGDPEKLESIAEAFASYAQGEA